MGGRDKNGAWHLYLRGGGEVLTVAARPGVASETKQPDWIGAEGADCSTRVCPPFLLSWMAEIRGMENVLEEAKRREKCENLRQSVCLEQLRSRF